MARSHNFYPVTPMTSTDGVAAVALGLGVSVVDGEPCLRFCPRYPQHLLQFSSVKVALKNSQREFFALRLDAGEVEADGPGEVGLARFGLEVAERDGTLRAVASTYSRENDAIYDGLSRPACGSSASRPSSSTVFSRWPRSWRGCSPSARLARARRSRSSSP